MSIKCINENPELLRAWIEKEKKNDEIYLKNNKDSLIPLFENELRELGFSFEITNQTFLLMPKYKNVVVPIAIKYYQLAKKIRNENEVNHFLSFFNYRGLEGVVPMLLDDYRSSQTPDLTKWFISSCLYSIRSNKLIAEYLEIISNADFGNNRKMIILLVGKLKVESATQHLIDLLEDEQVRLHAICALADFKKEEFRCHFERFQNSTHPGWRKYSRMALKKLNANKTN